MAIWLELVNHFLDELLGVLGLRLLHLELALVNFHSCDLVLVVVPHRLSALLNGFEQAQIFLILLPHGLQLRQLSLLLQLLLAFGINCLISLVNELGVAQNRI